jgi:hypothetical protein
MSSADNPFAPMPHVTIGACVSRGLSLYTSNLGWLAAAGLLAAVVQAFLIASTAGWAILLGMVLTVPAYMGVYAVASAGTRGEAIDVHTLLSGFKDPRAYALGVAQSVLLVVSILLFVLPVFVSVVGLTWSAVALQRRPDIGAIDAIKRSFGLARKHLGITLLITLMAIIFDSLGTGTLLLGAVTIPIMVCVKLIAFEAVDDGLHR